MILFVDALRFRGASELAAAFDKRNNEPERGDDGRTPAFHGELVLVAFPPDFVSRPTRSAPLATRAPYRSSDISTSFGRTCCQAGLLTLGNRTRASRSRCFSATSPPIVAKADRLRDDLSQSGIGNGRHAFEVAIDDDPHFSTVRVRIRGTDYFLHNALEKAARRNGERFNNSMLDGVPTLPWGFSERQPGAADERVCAEIIAAARGFTVGGGPSFRNGRRAQFTYSYIRLARLQHCMGRLFSPARCYSFLRRRRACRLVDAALT